MEELLSLKYDLNLSIFNYIWCLYKIEGNINIHQNIIINTKNINKEIIYVYDILNKLIITYSKKNNYINLIITIKQIINIIKNKIKSTKYEIENNCNKDKKEINKFIEYMDSVIENGYIDFDKYQQNNLFKEFINY